MSRVVAGTLLLPNGLPMANASIYFTAKRTEPVSIIEGSNTFFNTSAAGVYSQSVVNGFYAVSIQYIADASGAHTRRWQLGDVFIEDGATTTLEALIIASNVPDDIALGVFYEILEEAQAAAASASASAAAAAASAATIVPTNSPTDTTPGHLWRTNDLVKATSQIDSVAGRMLRVGDGGILGTAPLPPSNDLNSAPGTMASGLYRYESATVGLPLAGTNGNLVHMRRASGGGESRLAIRDSDTASAARAFIQVRSTSAWQPWEELWHSGNLVKTTSTTDTTTGNMLKVGDYGLGGDCPVNSSLDDDNFTSAFQYSSAATGNPNASAAGVGLTLHRNSSTTALRSAQLLADQQFRSHLRFNVNGTWTVRELWHSGNQLGIGTTASSARVAIDSSVFPSYTVATVPVASANPNKGIIVTNAASGRRPYWSNGTDWRDAANTILS